MCSKRAGFAPTRPLHFFIPPDETLPTLPSASYTTPQTARASSGSAGCALNVPFDWQDAVIRASITLLLCSFAETVRHLAAPLATSIRNSPDNESGITGLLHSATRISPSRRSPRRRSGTMERFIGYPIVSMPSPGAPTDAEAGLWRAAETI